MANVRFIQTTKQKWLYRFESGTCDPTALYFCIDTGELFKGATLFTSGTRIIQAYDDLPPFTSAADNIVYYCIEDASSYLLSPERDSWIEITSGMPQNIDEMISVKINETLNTEDVILDGGDLSAIIDTDGGEL